MPRNMTEPRDLAIGDWITIHADRWNRLRPISMMIGHGPNVTARVDGLPIPTSLGEWIIPVDGQRITAVGRVEVAR